MLVLSALDLATALAVRRSVLDDDVESRPERLDDGCIRCPDCETITDPTYRFCRECGVELQASAGAVPSRPAGGRPPFR